MVRARTGLGRERTNIVRPTGHLKGDFVSYFLSASYWRTPTSVAGLCPIAVREAAMYRRPLLLVLLALTLAGCYGGPGYYESDVYTQPATVVGGGYAYDNGYRSTYYQERRIYVAPQPRYYGPAPRYYAPPPVPRYYQPGRPPGYGWGDNRYRGGNPGYRNDPRRDYRGGPSWGDHGGNRGHDGRGPGRGDGRGGRGGDGRGGHR